MLFTCFISFLTSCFMTLSYLSYFKHLATFFTVFILKMASCMRKPNIQSYRQKICFRSLFFVKIVAMFKLLGILLIINLYVRNDIFKCTCVKQRSLCQVFYKQPFDLILIAHFVFSISCFIRLSQFLKIIKVFFSLFTLVFLPNN